MAISVDLPAKSAQIMQRYGLSFPFLSDPDFKAIDAYGLRHRGVHLGRDAAIPTMILVDRAGRILSGLDFMGMSGGAASSGVCTPAPVHHREDFRHGCVELSGNEVSELH